MRTGTTTRTRTIRALCVPLAVLAIGAAGCSASSSTSSSAPKSGSQHSQATQASPADVVAAAYARTAAAKTAKVALTGTVAGQQITGSGVEDLAQKNSDLTLQTPQGPVESRTVSGISYIKLPAAARSLLKGKQWLKVDPGSSAGSFASTPQPTDILGYLQGLSSSVTKVGTETVRGTQTTHYKATIDLDKVAAKAGTTKARQQINALETRTGVKSFPVGLWIGPDGMVRRVQTTVPSAKGEKVDTGGQVTIELYDFGTPVNVVAPPASEVADASALAGGLGGN